MRTRNVFISLICTAALLAVAMFGVHAEAKSSGGGSHSSGSHSSSGRSGSSGSKGYSNSGQSKPAPSKSSGYSNSGAKAKSEGEPASAPPAAPQAAPGPKSADQTTTPQEAKPSSGYANSATKNQPAPNAPPGNVPQTALQRKTDRAMSKQESAKALNEYKAQRAQFKAQDNPVASSAGTQNAVLGTIGKTGTPSLPTYYETRRQFYNANQYVPAPYIYQSRPAFGMWDSIALWFILDHFRDDRYSAMYYHHMDDPGMQEWRREADRLAAENADLKEKLAGLDTKVASMNNVPKDPSYVPDDMKETVLAPDAADKLFPAAAAAEDVPAPAPQAPAKSSHTVLYGVAGVGVLAAAVWAIRRAKRG